MSLGGPTTSPASRCPKWRSRWWTVAWTWWMGPSIRLAPRRPAPWGPGWGWSTPPQTPSALTPWRRPAPKRPRRSRRLQSSGPWSRSLASRICWPYSGSNWRLLRLSRRRRSRRLSNRSNIVYHKDITILIFILLWWNRTTKIQTHDLICLLFSCEAQLNKCTCVSVCPSVRFKT